MHVDLRILEEVGLPGSRRNLGEPAPTAPQVWLRRGASLRLAAEDRHSRSRAIIPSIRAADHQTAAASQQVEGPTLGWEDPVVAAILPR